VEGQEVLAQVWDVEFAMVVVLELLRCFVIAS
jgi:hypothetical protein